MGRYPHPTHGWDAVRLYRNLTAAELQEMLKAVSADPANANPEYANGSSIYYYTKSARKKMDALSWAITYHLQDRTT